MKASITFLLLCLFFFGPSSSFNNQRSFEIDYDSNLFLKDGKPFQYLSGSVHYARIPPEYWDDRLKKIRAGGLNAIQFYVEWRLHEPRPGVYDFNGWRDIGKFLKLAQSNDLLVLLRPGPFIDGERDMGGLPSWLLENGTIALRKNDPKFTQPVLAWFDKLFEVLKDYIYSNGGPIIMIQLENEYGSYGCDTAYLSLLRDAIYSKLGGSDKVVLYTTDGASIGLIRCGYIPEALTTVDFGPGSPPGSMEGALNQSKLFRPKGPLVNSEFYTGWLDHWGSPHAVVKTDVVAKALDWLLSKKVNVNLYMVHGGTSFGFEAGANGPPFLPNPTSYDYDAPISEAGDMTWKYESIKAVASKYFPIPKISVSNSSKLSLGKVFLKGVTSLHYSKDLFLSAEAKSKEPLSFEDLKQGSGFILYEALIPKGKVYPSPVQLSIEKISDRGNVYLNERPLGVLGRMFGSASSLPLMGVKGGEKLSILVENQGRICFGNGIAEHKGILSKVILGKDEIINWNMTGVDFGDVSKTQMSLDHLLESKNTLESQLRRRGLRYSEGQNSFWHGHFKVPCHKMPSDTFVDLSNWSKGLVFVNGVNLGRYWPAVGPQETLYLPGAFLNCHTMNNITLFEQDAAPSNRANQFIELVDTHRINGATPS